MAGTLAPAVCRSILSSTNGVTAAPVTPAFAHAHLSHSEPGANTTVAEAPKQLVLTFTEQLEPSFSGVTLGSLVEIHRNTDAVEINHVSLYRTIDVMINTENRDIDQRGLLGVAEDRADVLLGGPVVEPGVLDEPVHGVGDIPVAVVAGLPDVPLEHRVADHMQRGPHVAAPAPPRHVVEWHAPHRGRVAAATGRLLRTLHKERWYAVEQRQP